MKCRQGRHQASSRQAARLVRKAVMPSGLIAGNRCLAKAAPRFTDTCDISSAPTGHAMRWSVAFRLMW